jgi:anti-sigma-K factor RskA
MNDRPLAAADAGIPERMGEAIAAYALSALSPEEKAAVVAYLAAHPAARSLLAEYRAIVGLLPHAVAPSVPPAAFRHELLRTIRTTRSRTRAVGLTVRARCAAAIAAGLVLALLLWSVGLQLRLLHTAMAVSTVTTVFSIPGLDAYDLRPDRPAPGATGRIYLTPDGRQATLVVAGLPALSPDETYQLWFRTANQGDVSMGTFAVDARGGAVIVVPIAPARVGYISCGITKEPQGGSRTPMGARVLASGVWDDDPAHADADD